MNNYLIYFVGFFVITNTIAFLMMWIDKYKAKKRGSQRISEGRLFFMATIFGSIGVYLGMFIFRHKTRNWHFIIGIPFLIIQNITFLYVLYLLNTNLVS